MPMPLVSWPFQLVDAVVDEDQAHVLVEGGGDQHHLQALQRIDGAVGRLAVDEHELLDGAIAQSPKVTRRSALMPAVDQLAQARDAEARGQHLVLDAAAQGGGHADHQVDAVLFLQRRPAVDDVAVVLRRLGQPRRVVDTVVIEEHALHLVPLGDGGGGER
jgi:hypothetical protein